MKKCISLIILFWYICSAGALSIDSNNQPNVEWERIQGGSEFDACYCVQETDDGGFVFAGGSYSFGPGQSDLWIIKTDSNGNTLWNKTYGGPANESCYCIQKTNDDCFVVTGKTKTSEPNNYDALLLKIDSEGNELWSVTYGGEEFDAGWWVEPTNDEGFILVGVTESKGNGNGDIWVVKTNENGEIIWEQTYGGALLDEAEEILVLENDRYIIVGSTESFCSNGKDIIVLCIDNDGSQIWQKTYGGKAYDEGWSIELIDENTYYILGRTSSFGSGGQDFWLLKINEEGEVLLNRTFGKIGLDQVRRIKKANQDTYLISGCTQSDIDDDIDFWLISIDEKGLVKWDTIFGDQDVDICYDTKQTSDLGYILTGMTYNNQNQGDSFIIKLSSYENQQPTAPEKPEGKTKIQPKKDYTYITSSTDPDKDKLWYQWYWDDGTISEWIGPYENSEICEQSHNWMEKGTYEIKVRTKDENGGESDWSEPLLLQVKKSKYCNNHDIFREIILELFLKFDIFLKRL